MVCVQQLSRFDLPGDGMAEPATRFVVLCWGVSRELHQGLTTSSDEMLPRSRRFASCVLCFSHVQPSDWVRSICSPCCKPSFADGMGPEIGRDPVQRSCSNDPQREPSPEKNAILRHALGRNIPRGWILIAICCLKTCRCKVPPQAKCFRACLSEAQWKRGCCTALSAYIRLYDVLRTPACEPSAGWSKRLQWESARAPIFMYGLDVTMSQDSLPRRLEHSIAGPYHFPYSQRPHKNPRFCVPPIHDACPEYENLGPKSTMSLWLVIIHIICPSLPIKTHHWPSLSTINQPSTNQQSIIH